MDEAIKLIRSLLIVSSGGLSIDQINKEYREEVGEWIPFKKFGFNSLEDLLRASGQFSGKRTAAGTIVTAKLTKNSAHIIEMRSNQSVSAGERKRRKKFATKKASLARPQIRSNTMTSRTRNQTSTTTRLNSMPQRRPFSQNGTKNPTSMATVSYAPMATVSTSNQQPKQPTITSHNEKVSQNTNEQCATVDKPAHKQLTSNESRPIANGYLSQVESSIPSKPKLKINLQSRLAPKQTESKIPDELPSSYSNDLQSPLSPKQLNIRLVKPEEQHRSDSEPKTPDEEPPIQTSKRSTKSYTPATTPAKSRLNPDLYARLGPKVRDIEQRLVEPSLAPMSTSTKPSGEIAKKLTFDERPKTLNLHARLTAKQPSPVANEIEESTISSSTIPPRNKLLKILQECQKKHEAKEESPEKIKKSIAKRLVTFDPKTVIIGGESIIENGQPKTATQTIEEMPKLVTNIHARLQPKQTQQNSDIDQLSEKLNGVSLMEVDDTTDSPEKKANLHSRLQQKQLEMDWEEISWTRSVRQIGSGMLVTIQF